MPEDKNKNQFEVKNNFFSVGNSPVDGSSPSTGDFLGDTIDNILKPSEEIIKSPDFLSDAIDSMASPRDPKAVKMTPAEQEYASGLLGRGFSVRDAEELNRLLGTNWSPYEDDYQDLLASAQPTSEILGRAFNKFNIKFAAGVLEGISSWDLEDISGYIAGTEAEYGNWAHDLANELNEYADEKNKIYTTTDGAYNFAKIADVSSQAGFSLSLIHI